jgi:hypothetical protein
MVATLSLFVIFVLALAVLPFWPYSELGLHSEHATVCCVGNSLHLSDHRGVLTLVTLRQRYQEGLLTVFTVSKRNFFETQGASA